MARKIPSDLRKEIYAIVYEKADEHQYMTRDRVSNGQFILNLVNDSQVGKRLVEYIPKDRIKTYIKDSILNRYSKDKTKTEVPQNVNKHIKSVFGRKALEISYKKSARVSLHRFEDSQDLLVVARGTYIKWETAIRKALEFISACPGVPSPESKLFILLVITTTGRILTSADKSSLKNVLNLISIEIIFFDDI